MTRTPVAKVLCSPRSSQPLRVPRVTARRAATVMGRPAGSDRQAIHENVRESGDDDPVSRAQTGRLHGVADSVDDIGKRETQRELQVARAVVLAGAAVGASVGAAVKGSEDTPRPLPEVPELPEAMQQADTQDFPDLIGVLLADRYRVESLLAVGSVCEVYRARHLYLDRSVALKTLRELPLGQAHPPSDQERLLREARALARLKHPHVVRIFDYGVTEEGRSYLVTELLEGSTLEQVLGQLGARLPLRRACRLGAQVARIMAELHALGLVLGGQEGGLKASNLLIEQEAQEAGGERVRLVDLSGVAPAGPAGRRVLALPEPEGGDSSVTPGGQVINAGLRRRDEQALGELLYRMLTGAPLARRVIIKGAPDPAVALVDAARDGLSRALPDRERPIVAALEALLLRALFGSERRDQSGVSARHLEQVLQQVAHLEGAESALSPSGITSILG